MMSILILVLPLPWVSALLLCCGIHEIGHWLALRLSGVPIYKMILGAGGVILKTGDMTPIQGMLSAAAGPLMPLVLLLFADRLPHAAMCAIIQGIYHLIPVAPLDGGRVLENLIGFMGWDPRILTVTQWFAVLVLVFLGVWLLLQNIGIILPIFCFLLLLRIIPEKLLANRRGNEYNRCTNP